MVVEGLRIQFAGDAEAWGVVQDHVEAGIGQGVDGLGHVRVHQVQTAAVLGRVRIGRPGVERAQPQHAFVLLERIDACGAGVQAAGGEIAQAAAGVEHRLALRLHQGHLAPRILQRRLLRGRQHLDAVDLEGGYAPFGGHQLDQGAGVARHRGPVLAIEPVHGALTATLRVRVPMALPVPAPVLQQCLALAAAQVERTVPVLRALLVRGQQAGGGVGGEQGAGRVRHGRDGQGGAGIVPEPGPVPASVDPEQDRRRRHVAGLAHPTAVGAQLRFLPPHVLEVATVEAQRFRAAATQA